MIWPVTKSEAGESRYRAMPMKSSGSPRRPNGMRAWLRARESAPASVSAKIQFVSAERKTAGAIAFTLIRRRPHSVASTFVSASVAPFEVQYAVYPAALP
jgi:hypothetical protein